ncbi:phosphoadenosine phosphosulfate reductase [Ammoniphilus oxalaticus]|uniref:Adenosine 5'-phosphosulfate reductase n=1 Tax=Ammoniphilus oxalaticus TaxID=66863 RepID=A0A419SII5_9BACL|nr:phosphoadenylyl-sulfate reductase [Ammoniphilus oxalaticus]RKD23805.1 phosphoadenosine phosphosulfate reductase [Ammoniphilus oxalaticus]
MKETAVGLNVGELNKRFENQSAEQVLRWAHEKFGRELLLACSFGAEDVALVEMYSRSTITPQIFYLDTDKHFQETYDTRDQLTEKYGVRFIQVKPEISLDEQAERYGDRLWETDPNQCCFIRKVEPLQGVLRQAKAWITGIRRDQSHTRANAQRIEWDNQFGLFKINPLVSWTSTDVWNYIKDNQIPYNPLHDQNYPSIGCDVCTRPVQPGEDQRAGRWAGSMKTECGLHKGAKEGSD